MRELTTLDGAYRYLPTFLFGCACIAPCMDNLDHALEQVPLRWILQSKQSDVTIPTYSAAVQAGEFFVFQVGVLATGATQPVTVTGYDLVPAHSTLVIDAAQLNCFNLEGTTYKGARFRQNATVPAGKVGSLWFGVSIPASAQPAQISQFALRLDFGDATSILVNVTLTVSKNGTTEMGGDRNASRLSRLRWLDSARFLDHTNSRRYTPLRVTGSSIEFLNRRIGLDGLGLPEQIVPTSRWARG